MVFVQFKCLERDHILFLVSISGSAVQFSAVAIKVSKVVHDKQFAWKEC